MERKEIILIPGDGIGPEVCEAVQMVVEHSGAPIDWIEAPAGLAAVSADCPSGLPQATIELLRANHMALKGPTTTPSGSGHRSVNVAIRKRLGLFANVRPVKSLPGVPTQFEKIDLVLVRENIEDTYSGIEYRQSAGVAQGLKLVTRVGTERVVRFAFEYARREKRKQVTCVHKANIHKLTDGLFLEIFQQIAEEYSDLESSDVLVDNMSLQLVTRPETFDVLVAPNLYGDILSDLCAGLVGGLGLAPSGNIGNRNAVFEAVHGSAPDIAGKGRANPTALLLSATMMLRHAGYSPCADAIVQALLQALENNEKTADLGGQLSTSEFAHRVAERMIMPEPLDRPEPSGMSIHELTTAEDSGSQPQERGVDVYVVSQGRPSFPESVAGMQLASISNRGVLLDDKISVEPSDIYCGRYFCEGVLQESQVAALFSELSATGLRWTSCEKLIELDGKPGYSTPS